MVDNYIELFIRSLEFSHEQYRKGGIGAFFIKAPLMALYNEPSEQ